MSTNEKMPLAEKTARDIAAALGVEADLVEETDDGWITLCPVHEADGAEHTPSLVVFHQGNVHCRTGCRKARIEQELGKLSVTIVQPGAWETLWEHTWRSIDGEWCIRHWKGRKAGEDPVITWKHIPWAQRETDGWSKAWVKGMPHKIHGLEALPAPFGVLDMNDTNWLLLVEGEKDCNTANALGHSCTTGWKGASGKWGQEYLDAVAGKDLVLVPDHDQAGEGWVKTAVETFYSVAASVRVVWLPGMDDGEDLTDWYEGLVAAGRAPGAIVDDLDDLIDAAAVVADPGRVEAPSVAWIDQLKMGDKGPLRIRSNFELILAHSPELDPFILDTGTDQLLNRDDVAMAKKNKVLAAVDRALTGVYGGPVGTKAEMEMVRLAVEKINLTTSWFYSVPAWDGTDRLCRLFIDGFKSKMDARYLGAVATCQMIGTVARAYQPGCKHDTAVILCGPTGTGKSKALAALCPGEGAVQTRLMAEHPGGAFDQKQIRNYLGKLFIEVPEQSVFDNPNKTEQLKAIMSIRVDNFDEKYEGAADYPRTWLLWPTINSMPELLQDPTGNRRFNPVQLYGVDVDWIVENRTQLWAESIARYRAGEPNWIVDEEIEAMAVAAQVAALNIDWDLIEKLFDFTMAERTVRNNQVVVLSSEPVGWFKGPDFFRYAAEADKGPEHARVKREFKSIHKFFGLTYRQRKWQGKNTAMWELTQKFMDARDFYNADGALTVVSGPAATAEVHDIKQGSQPAGVASEEMHTPPGVTVTAIEPGVTKVGFSFSKKNRDNKEEGN